MQISEAPYRTIAEAAHLAPIEQPGQVADAMVAFLREHAT